MKLSEKNYKRAVVKIGSSLLYSDKNKPDTAFIKAISAEVSALAKEGKEVILVSSGAVACGMSLLRLNARPKGLPNLQAAAALGQPELMHAYQEAFKENSLNCAQILLTWEDFDDRTRYLNAKNTLLSLLKLKGVPVINENDSVSTDEIKFGDNDRLSAMVAGLISADILLILSDVDGLLMQDRKTLIRVVADITADIKSLACPTKAKRCVGGMVTKIEAARIAVDSGIPCVIAGGRQAGVISSLLKSPDSYGTLFLPKKGYLTARERWIAFSAKPKGMISVDNGAKNALIGGKSLLSVGVVSLSGQFYEDDVVLVTDKEGVEFARGRAGVSARGLEKIKGQRSEKEVIHRNNLVLL